MHRESPSSPQGLPSAPRACPHALREPPRPPKAAPDAQNHKKIIKNNFKKLERHLQQTNKKKNSTEKPNEYTTGAKTTTQQQRQQRLRAQLSQVTRRNVRSTVNPPRHAANGSCLTACRMNCTGPNRTELNSSLNFSEVNTREILFPGPHFSKLSFGGSVQGPKLWFYFSKTILFQNRRGSLFIGNV